MYLFSRCSAVPVAILLLAAGGTAVRAQSADAVRQTARVLSPVESRQTARLQGHVPAWATAENDLGSVPANRPLDNLHLILARSPQVQAAFEQLLADQQNPATPRYHQWLTPEQNAAQYGIAPADLSAVTDWLQSQGLSVDNVAAGGVFITFSGPASVVENAFSTSLHNFSHDNGSHYAPTTEPAVPAALAGVIDAIGGLPEQMAHVHSHKSATEESVQTSGNSLQPLFNSGSSTHYVSPGDFNTIYDINSTHNAGFTGTGIRVANLIDSRIATADITGFNKVFGLSVAQPNQILLPGSKDPGLDSDSEGEATLDVQRILGTAPGTTVDLLVFSSLSFTNIYSALQYEISTLNDPVVNMSFGSCDSGIPASYSSRFDSYFQTGAAQGISFFVSSGDNGAAGCDDNTDKIPATQVLSTNLICASSYATCVGGTEFAETSGGGYWSTSNSSTKVSATGYIPEGAWNEPTYVSNGKTTYEASGTGGGITSLPKPSWQTGVGVPDDGKRDVPDVSFTSAYHDGYLICQADAGNDCSAGTFKYIIFGTSAAAPSMAGVTAMLDQKTGMRQGNLNPLFYHLAATSSDVFHDATIASSGVSSCVATTPSMCNNSTPSVNSLTGGLAGYTVGTGYDEATGLGSLDVANFLAAAAANVSSAPTVTTSLAVTASPNPATTTEAVILTATLTDSSTSTPTGTVQFYSNGSALGSAVAIDSGTATSSALTFSTAGTYAITAAYSGDSAFANATSPAVSLVVNSSGANPVPSFTVMPSVSALTVAAGATAGNTNSITLTSVNGFTGSVALMCSVTGGTGTAPSCSLSPVSVTLTADGTAKTVAILSTSTQSAGSGNPGLPTGGAILAGLLLLMPFRRRRIVRSLAAFLVLLGGLAAMSGCGSGGAVASKTLSNDAGTYAITVTGTGTAAGTSNVVTASTTFTLTVN